MLHRWFRGSVLACLVGGLIAWAGSARAQTSLTSSSIDVQQFKPGPSSLDLLTVQSAQALRHLQWDAQLYLNYADGSLRVVTRDTQETVYRLVGSQFTADLQGALGIADFAELGLSLPLTFQGSDARAANDPSLVDGFSSFGPGDLRLVPKVHLVQNAGGFHLGLSAPLTLPTGGARSFLGGAGLSVQPRALIEYARPEFRVAANLGVALRQEQRLRDLSVGNELTFGVGGEVPFSIAQEKLVAQANLYGASGLVEGAGPEERPLELLLGVGWRATESLTARLGAGKGLSNGYGTPLFRVFAGLTFQQPQEARPVVVEEPAPKLCAEGPEDVDGFQDEDACADPDNDGDGVLDAPDVCPNDAETKNGFEDEDGCPDTLPLPAPPQLSLAPTADTDGDGVLDDLDRCVTVVEDRDGFQDADGCPEPDNDGDGIADAQDQCPIEAETINGNLDTDGCPDPGKSKVLIEAGKIVILEKVYFATGKDTILPKSFNLLGQVVSILQANPLVEQVRVEGHTDSQGDDAYNLTLSQRRAESVRRFLIEKGIAEDRLIAVGYGETKPVEDNKSAKGREANRRVEFVIEKMGMQEIEVETP